MNRLDSLYPVSEAENDKKLEAFEADFFPVPASFRDILLGYNLAKPRRTDFPGRPSFHLNALFGFSDLATENFPEVVKAYGGRMAEHLFPIGSIDGGICSVWTRRQEPFTIGSMRWMTEAWRVMRPKLEKWRKI